MDAYAGQKIDHVLREDHRACRGQLRDRPPAMLGHHLVLPGGPMVAQDHLAGGTHEEVALIGHDELAIGQLQDEAPLCHRFVYGIEHDAGLLEQLAPCRVRERFSGLHGTAGRGPIVLAGEDPVPEHESKQQQLVAWVEHEEA